jgi:hypothetical protein
MVAVGQWGPEPFLDRRGRPLTSLAITVYETDEVTFASLYTDQTGVAALSNPLPTGVATTAAGLDVRGNGTFYAEPGPYVLAVLHGGTEVYRTPITVAADDDLVLTDYVAKAGDTMTGTLTMQDTDIAIVDPPFGATRGVRATWTSGPTVKQGYVTPWGVGAEAPYPTTFGAYVADWGHVVYNDTGYAEMLAQWIFVTAESWGSDDPAVYVTGGALTQNVTWTRSGTTITVTTPLPHHRYPGETSITFSASSDTAALTNGSKTAVSTPSLNTFTITGLNAGAASGTATYTVYDPGQLFSMNYDGKFYFGPNPLGAGTADTNLYRSAPNVLQTDDEFRAGEDIRAGEATKNGTDGLILYSPDGTAYRVTVNNGGTLSVSAA